MVYVHLMRGPKEPIVYEHHNLTSAKQRIDALCDLHSCGYHKVVCNVCKKTHSSDTHFYILADDFYGG